MSNVDIIKMDNMGTTLSWAAQFPVVGYVATATKIVMLGIMQMITALVVIILFSPFKGRCQEERAHNEPWYNDKAWDHLSNGAQHFLIGIVETLPIAGYFIAKEYAGKSQESDKHQELVNPLF